MQRKPIELEARAVARVDAQQIRQGIILATSVLDRLAAVTETKLDDHGVCLIRDMCLDDEQWGHLEGIVEELRDALTLAPQSDPSSDALAKVRARANALGISPAVWMRLVEIVLAILAAYTKQARVMGAAKIELADEADEACPPDGCPGDESDTPTAP